MSRRLFLLDGTLLFFRALYGLPDVFTDDEGRPINGLRGYLSYLFKLINGHGVDQCIATFDESLTTCWRNEVYPDYKANRPEADDNIRQQLTLCRMLTALLGIPVVADLRYEADDFIATLAQRHVNERPADDVVIVSRDKDLQQLLNSRVSLLDPADGRQSSPADFVSKFSFEPLLFPDYQALTGDSVDNIPGVRGIGPKSAQRLVEAFGGLEDIYARRERWDQVGIKAGSKMAARLVDEQAQAFTYRRILRLDEQVPVTLELADAELKAPERAGLVSELGRLGLSDGLAATLVRTMEAYCV